MTQTDTEQTKTKKRFSLHAFLSEQDLTGGNLFWKLPLFALPMALTTILQLMYSTIDLVTVSKYGGGSTSMSAVGSNTALINLIVLFFTSLALGTNVIMAQAKGAMNHERCGKVLHTSILVALILGVSVGLFGYFMTPYLLTWMQTPISIYDKAADYMKIYFMGLPFLMIYNYGSNALRAIGDSQRPFYFLTIAGIINIVFDLLFVKAFHMDVKGVAYATIISEAVSAILTLLWLFFYKKGYVHLSFKEMRIDMPSLKAIIRIGLPSAIQNLGYYIPGVLIQSSLYKLTAETIQGVSITVDEVVAGSSASAQIENYAYAFIEAFCTAATSFVSQNYGALKKDNVKKVYWYALIWTEISWVLCALVCGFFAGPLLRIFIRSGDETVRESAAILAGRERLWLLVFTYCLDAIMDVTSYYLRGLGYSTSPSLVTVISCVGIRIFFLAVLFPLSTFHNLLWLLAVYPISWTVASVILIPMCIILQKKTFRAIDRTLALRMKN